MTWDRDRDSRSDDAYVWEDGRQLLALQATNSTKIKRKSFWENFATSTKRGSGRRLLEEVERAVLDVKTAPFAEEVSKSAYDYSIATPAIQRSAYIYIITPLQSYSVTVLQCSFL